MINKIRVAHILPTLAAGGAERMAVHIVNGVDRKRFDILVISIWREFKSDLEELLSEAGIKVLHLGKDLGFDWRIYFRLHDTLTNYRPDIIHTHLGVLRYALPSMLRFRRTSMSLHTVNNIAEREVEPRARWIQRYAFTHGVLPIAVAEKVARSVERLYGIPLCQAISNCIPTALYKTVKSVRVDLRARHGFADEDVLFVCVARLEAQKNHALLLNAFAQGPGLNPKAHLLLIGDGILRERLKHQAGLLGLADHIHFLGLRADIPSLLGAMDVFVLASDYEGSPLSIVEAMAAGLPIVSTAAGGVPELIVNGTEGLVVPVGDVGALAEAMTYLFENREKRLSFGQAATATAKERFDVSVMVHAYEVLYQDLFTRSVNRNRDNQSHATVLTEKGLA